MKQISKVCQSAYLELRRISSVRHVLTVEATKPLVTSLVLSGLDYCNSLLSGMPQQLIGKLQKVQNCSARLIFKTSKRTHASPLLTKLHWLPIAQRIEYKVSSMCYDAVSNTALLTCLTCFTCTSHPVHCIPLLMPTHSGCQNERKTSKGNALFPIWALSHGINSHTL